MSNSLRSKGLTRLPKDSPGSSVPGIVQARILECVARPSSRGSCQICNLLFPALGRRFFTSSTPWEDHIIYTYDPLTGDSLSAKTCWQGPRWPSWAMGSRATTHSHLGVPICKQALSWKRPRTHVNSFHLQWLLRKTCRGNAYLWITLLFTPGS